MTEDENEQSEIITIEAHLSHAQGGRLVAILRAAAEIETLPYYSKKWREMAEDIIDNSDGELRMHRRPVRRPKDDDEVALNRVIKGEEPYPVLSRADARRAFVALTDEYSARELAYRLHVDSQTIVRWRKERRNGTLEIG